MVVAGGRSKNAHQRPVDTAASNQVKPTRVQSKRSSNPAQHRTISTSWIRYSRSPGQYYIYLLLPGILRPRCIAQRREDDTSVVAHDAFGMAAVVVVVNSDNNTTAVSIHVERSRVDRVPRPLGTVYTSTNVHRRNKLRVEEMPGGVSMIVYRFEFFAPRTMDGM